jgi:hypothetical protein
MNKVREKLPSFLCLRTLHLIKQNGAMSAYACCVPKSVMDTLHERKMIYATVDPNDGHGRLGIIYNITSKGLDALVGIPYVALTNATEFTRWKSRV